MPSLKSWGHQAGPWRMLWAPASPPLLPERVWEHSRGFSWGFVGKIRGGWAGGSPGHGGVGSNPGLSLSISAGEGGHLRPKAPWNAQPLHTHSKGLPDTPSLTSLSPQSLLLISPNQQRFNVFRARPGPRRRRPGTQCARAASWGISSSERQTILGGVNPENPPPAACPERERTLGPIREATASSCWDPGSHLPR